MTSGPYETVPISSLVLDPANARLHPDKNLEAIRGSISRWGQQRPILVSRHGRVVIAGNGTLTAMRSLNLETVDVKWTDLEGAEATAYALADNRTSELAEWDLPVLSAQLVSLDGSGITVSEFGFNLFDFTIANPDYSVVDDEADPDFDGMRSGVKRAIQIEFKIEDYDEAFELVKKLRSQGFYVGGIIIDALRFEKASPA